MIQIFAQYMGSVSSVTSVKWLWFVISIAGLAGVLVHLARVFKTSADAKGGEFSLLYGASFLNLTLVIVHLIAITLMIDVIACLPEVMLRSQSKSL